MKYWIEVSDGWSWDLLLKGKRGLYAPNKKRYATMFKGIDRGDIVIHYLITQMTKDKEKKSSIIGLSRVKSKAYVRENQIIVDLEKITELPKPIKFNVFSKFLEKYSIAMQKLIKVGMQRYLTEISQKDFEEIFKQSSG